MSLPADKGSLARPTAAARLFTLLPCGAWATARLPRARGKEGRQEQPANPPLSTPPALASKQVSASSLKPRVSHHRQHSLHHKLCTPQLTPLCTPPPTIHHTRVYHTPTPFLQPLRTGCSYSKHSKSRACIPTPPSPQSEHVATERTSRTGLEDSAVIA